MTALGNKKRNRPTDFALLESYTSKKNVGHESNHDSIFPLFLQIQAQSWPIVVYCYDLTHHSSHEKQAPAYQNTLLAENASQHICRNPKKCVAVNNDSRAGPGRNAIQPKKICHDPQNVARQYHNQRFAPVRKCKERKASQCKYLAEEN